MGGVVGEEWEEELKVYMIKIHIYIYIKLSKNK